MLYRMVAAIPRRVASVRMSSSSPTRLLSTTAQRLEAPALPAVSHLISQVLPSDSFQLLLESEKAGAMEDALYDQQIQEVEAWWASPRYEGIKRPYSAADIVSKRGTQLQSYPSSVMARKLFNLLKEREARGQPVHTCQRSLSPIPRPM